jgi:hypothetical protein
MAMIFQVIMENVKSLCRMVEVAPPPFFISNALWAGHRQMSPPSLGAKKKLLAKLKPA